MFEMAAGKQLETTIPSDKDYKSVKKPLRTFLKSVFDGKTGGAGACSAWASEVRAPHVYHT